MFKLIVYIFLLICDLQEAKQQNLPAGQAQK